MKPTNLITILLAASLHITGLKAEIDTFLVKTTYKHILQDKRFSPVKRALLQETLTKDKVKIREIVYDSTSGKLEYIRNFFYNNAKTQIKFTEKIDLENKLLSYTNYNYGKGKVTGTKTYTANGEVVLKETKTSYKKKGHFTKTYEMGKLISKKSEYYSGNVLQSSEITYLNSGPLKSVKEEFTYFPDGKIKEVKRETTHANNITITSYIEYEYYKSEKQPKFLIEYDDNRNFVSKTLLLYYTNGLLKSKSKLDDKSNYFSHYSTLLTTKPLHQDEIKPLSR